jgi:hypothetical protein
MIYLNLSFELGVAFGCGWQAFVAYVNIVACYYPTGLRSSFYMGTKGYLFMNHNASQC